MTLTPYYTDSTGRIVIYHGDCRDVLPRLSVEADVLLTDPPYAIINRFGENVMEDGGRRVMQFEWDRPEGVAEGVAKLKSSASVFVFTSVDIVERVAAPVRAAGFIVKPACWVKECPPPAGFGNWWPSGFELAFYAYRKSPYFNDTNPKRSNVFVADSYRYGQPGKVDHPTQKPLGLVSRIARSLVPQDGLLIDPFMGSGRSLRAAKDLGCQAIGIEIEERYCEIAAKRLAQEVLL